jgi:hypothetical protein
MPILWKNPAYRVRPRVCIALTCGAAIAGFASNSLLAPGALGGGQIDASTCILVRLSSGALLLGAISLLRRQSLAGHGSWAAAAALGAVVLLGEVLTARVIIAAAAIFIAIGLSLARRR